MSNDFDNNFEIEFLSDGGVVSPSGFEAGSARGAIKMAGDDVALVVCQTSATAAAVFTQNAVRAAPVLVSMQHAQSETTRAIIANSGNANCCTGAQGLENARKMCELAAQKIGCDAQEILVCSTGIIGHPLPMEKVESAMAALKYSRDQSQNESVARAVMTTDTRPKFCAARIKIGGEFVTVGGLAKGVGMIGPDMIGMQAGSTPGLHATLLSFLTTDAKVEKQLLQSELQRTANKSFNSVTVDGDTSTNDTAILLASGASGIEISEENLPPFRALLDAVCVFLAREVARDGEGATKIITIEIRGARTESDAKKCAMTIANSPLVKTAIFGNDPNWGRIAMAAGRSGARFDAKNLQIKLGGVQVFENGEPAAFDLPQAESALQKGEVEIQVSLGAGEANWTAWTCDFSYDYVKINAEYHT
jgi:glutamate N-acetyltransferase/amino-acid N-acetyltransferase